MHHRCLDPASRPLRPCTCRSNNGYRVVILSDEMARQLEVPLRGSPWLTAAGLCSVQPVDTDAPPPEPADLALTQE